MKNLRSIIIFSLLSHYQVAAHCYHKSIFEKTRKVKETGKKSESGWTFLIPDASGIFREKRVYTSEKDTLFLISFGNGNKKVSIKKEILQNYISTNDLGNKILEDKAYKFTIRNIKKRTVTLKLEDLIPFLKDNRIEVELIENSDAIIDIAKGKLSWNITLKPNEVRNIEVRYSVKYPKGNSLKD